MSQQRSKGRLYVVDINEQGAVRAYRCARLTGLSLVLSFVTAGINAQGLIRPRLNPFLVRVVSGMFEEFSVL